MIKKDLINLKSTEALKFIIDGIDALIYIIDIETYEILYANQHCIEEFGDIVGKTCYSVLQKDKKQACDNCDLLDNKYPKEVGATYKWEHLNTKNNKYYIFSDKITLINDRKVKVQIGINITKQKELETKILEQKTKNIETFEALSNSTIEGLIIYDENKHCVSTNSVAPELFGYNPNEMIGKNAFEFIAYESVNHVKQVINNQNQEPYEAIMLRKDGTKFPAILRGKDIQLEGKEIRVSAIMDITKIKEKEEEILKLAYYDSLTSLPNRSLLEDRANRLINKNSRNKNYGSLMFIDLDNFKNINDTKGHIIGDMILIECAKRLSKTIRRYDTVARFGGDEFIILIDTQHTDKNSAVKSVRTVANNVLTRLSKPLMIENTEYQLTASIGVAIFNDSITFDELMKRADSAMYHSKDKGKNSFSFFDPKLQKEIERKTLITDKLRRAIQNHKINIHYQKQYNHHQKVVGVEALLRWTDKTLGYISPIEFITIAEESDLILQLGNYVIEESIKLISSWEKDKVKKDWKISINISIKQFEKDNFVKNIENNIFKYNIVPNRLRLEFTESLLFKNTDKALEKINYLKNLGLTLSIDDFGTGYSSLSYLKKLPIDELKIDKSFIDDILTDENDETIVLAILGIGNKFGFEVIAEGVETKEMYEKLLTLGCRYFQGYYFAKPVPEEKL